jgi:hypothetical protein
VTRLRQVGNWAYRYRLSLWVVAFTIAVVWALGVGYQTDQHQKAADRREAREDRVEEAQACVRSWDVREEIRDAVERGTRGGAAVGARALIAVAEDATQERIAQYLRFIDEQADAEVLAARAEITDPECDLVAARQLLD